MQLRFKNCEETNLITIRRNYEKLQTILEKRAMNHSSTSQLQTCLQSAIVDYIRYWYK